MEAVFSKKYTVEVSDIDFRQQIKLSSLFGYLQDMATEHGYRIGVGRDVLQTKYGIIWVLARVKVDVIRYPKFKEEIVIETWPDQPGKLDFNRNFLVYDKDKNIIIKAMSQWVLIDFNTRRLRRSSILEEKFPESDRQRPLDFTPNKIKPEGNLVSNYKKTVGYSDIDLNEHLNNAKYIDYIMDCFSLEDHKKHTVKSIEINYLHEAMAGDTLELYTDISPLGDNHIYIEGINKSKNLTTFRAQLVTRSINEYE